MKINVQLDPAAREKLDQVCVCPDMVGAEAVQVLVPTIELKVKPVGNVSVTSRLVIELAAGFVTVKVYVVELPFVMVSGLTVLTIVGSTAGNETITQALSSKTELKEGVRIAEFVVSGSGQESVEPAG